jgi:hypothetical protein
MNTVLFYCTLAGLVFSGYMSGVKFFTSQCAFGEACPLFWGFPACYFGFALFLLLTISAGLIIFTRIPRKILLIDIVTTAGIGIAFAGYFTLRELPILLAQGLSAYVFGLPTCALGLIFFVAIFVIALREICSAQSLTTTEHLQH